MLRIFNKFVPNLLAKIRPDHKPMGRWNLEQSAKKMKNKVDLSNEDHCGPCGQYALQKLQTEPVPISPTSSISSSSSSSKQSIESIHLK